MWLLPSSRECERPRLKPANIRGALCETGKIPLLIAVIAALISSVLVSPSFAQFSVPTSHGDNTRTGANTNETLLKPDSIDKNNFGRLLPHDRSPMPAAMPAGDDTINATAGSGSAQFNETVQ